MSTQLSNSEAASTSADTRSVTFVSKVLRDARLGVGIELARVSLLCSIDTQRLRRIELGAIAPDAEELERLCCFYGCDIDRAQGVLPRLPARAKVEDGILHVGSSEVHVHPDQTNFTKLYAIASCLRAMRGLADDAAVNIRIAEVVTVGSVLDLEDEGLLADLVMTLKITASAAAELLDGFQASGTAFGSRTETGQPLSALA